MAAEVSSLARMLGGYNGEEEGERQLVTRDLLGSAGAATAEVDLLAPACLERHLDLQTVKEHLQQREPNPDPQHLHDLNLSPPWPSAACLGLKPAAAATSAGPAEYQSVCTLEKVKSALERESRLVANARALLPRPDGSISPPSSSSSIAAVTSTSTKRRAAAKQDEDEDGAAPGGFDSAGGAMMAVATCPACLIYVLIAKVDPRCPRCAAHVPVNNVKKKPRIDLNFSLSSW